LRETSPNVRIPSIGSGQPHPKKSKKNTKLDKERIEIKDISDYKDMS
jgi:hypothetical protein